MKDFERPPITENTLKNVLQHFSNLLRFEKSGGTDQEGGCTEMAYGDFHGNRSEGGKKKHNLISLQLQPKSYAHMQVTASPGREGDHTEAAQRQYGVSLSLPDRVRSAACLVLPFVKLLAALASTGNKGYQKC